VWVLKKTYYDSKYFINTKRGNILVIHNNSEANSSVDVIIETKKPTNKAEMIGGNNLNAKAFHELTARTNYEKKP
jgi:adenine-specific DNA-methyltransferase